MPWSLSVCAWRKGLVIDALNEMPRGYCIVGEDGCMVFMFCARAIRLMLSIAWYMNTGWILG